MVGRVCPPALLGARFLAPRLDSPVQPHGTVKALTPARVTTRAGLPAYLATPSRRSASNHVMHPGIALHARTSVPGEFRTSPCMSRLVVTPRRIEFVFLRTASSLPVALHPASRRRSYLRLRGLGLPRHGLPPCRCGAFTGALTPAKAGVQESIVMLSSTSWIPACTGNCSCVSSTSAILGGRAGMTGVDVSVHSSTTCQCSESFLMENSLT